LFRYDDFVCGTVKGEQMTSKFHDPLELVEISEVDNEGKIFKYYLCPTCLQEINVNSTECKYCRQTIKEKK